MPEKTYTLTELIKNLQERVNTVNYTQHDYAVTGEVIAALLGYDLTDEGYDRFDADLTALGL